MTQHLYRKQKTYSRMPCPLYQEVKGYVEDFLNKECIIKSQSPYSSPCVVICKRSSGLRLCIDYRELNKWTVQGRHPISRIQEILDNLGGNAWFSTLDQGKSYHQGFMYPSSRHLTAFVTPWGFSLSSGQLLSIFMTIYIIAQSLLCIQTIIL